MKALELRANATEAEIQSAICEYLRLFKIPFSVTNADRTYSRNGKVTRSKVYAGWPDITACLNGRFWGIEVKSKKGRLRPAQKEVLKMLEEANGIITIARSLDDLIPILEKHSHIINIKLS